MRSARAGSDGKEKKKEFRCAPPHSLIIIIFTIVRATGDEADSHENMFHLHFHFHGNEDSCTETRFEREAKATPRE